MERLTNEALPDRAELVAGFVEAAGALGLEGLIEQVSMAVALMRIVPA